VGIIETSPAPGISSASQLSDRGSDLNPLPGEGAYLSCPFSGKMTSQAQSDQDAIDHPEVIGGKRIYQHESVILNAAAFFILYVGQAV